MFDINIFNYNKNNNTNNYLLALLRLPTKCYSIC